MSILIKGMRMPEKGFVDVRLFADGRATTQSSESPYYKQMDVIEIPEPHGDLIDRSAFRTDYGMGENCDKCGKDLRSCEYDFIYSKMDFCGWIDDAPTVIEGSENHDD